MDKQSVIEFFDRWAPRWDADMVRSDEIIGIILDNAGVTQGKKVLDVACGTGVLISDYLERKVSSVCAIDLSPEMIKIAARKYPQRNVNLICGDVEETEFEDHYDCIVIYNAFPHFPDPERLISRLCLNLKPGGYLTVAHGMSRDRINAHHSGSASKVSVGLLSADDLSNIFSRYLTVTAVISDERMYQVVGQLNIR